MCAYLCDVCAHKHTHNLYVCMCTHTICDSCMIIRFSELLCLQLSVMARGWKIMQRQGINILIIDEGRVSRTGKRSPSPNQSRVILTLTTTLSLFPLRPSLPSLSLSLLSLSLSLSLPPLLLSLSFPSPPPSLS